MEPDFPTYLKPLAYRRHNYPRAAMEAALADREGSVPHLVRGIEYACEYPDARGPEGTDYMMHLFALFLLAQFREESALPVVVRLAKHPEVEWLLGDCITEDLPRIFASVCGADTTPIRELIEDTQADEFVRSSALEALEILKQSGQLTRDEFSAFVGHLFAVLPREGDYIWTALCYACGQYRLAEYLPEVRNAYREGLADPKYETLARIEEEMASVGARAPSCTVERGMVTDAIADTEGWTSGFDEDDPLDRPAAPPEPKPPVIGRNDPCPCGSGKKYKKCCL